MVAERRTTRCVFDTNVLVSALLFADSQPATAFARAQQDGVVLMSIATLNELQEVLSRPKFEAYLTTSERDEFLRALVESVEIIEIVQRIHACRDPNDDKFLEVAVNGAGTHIVTGDNDLLVLDPFQSIRIVSPAMFLTF